MSWFLKELGGGPQTYAPTNQLREAFWHFYRSNHCAVEIAMFSRYDLAKNMVTVYLSPAAKTFAMPASFVPCDRPLWDADLSLIGGDAQCLEVLFPESLN